MRTPETAFEGPRPTIGWAVAFGRRNTGQSLRRLAKTSGVSVAQLSRLEAEQVDRPSVETLVALAPALNQHPVFLFVLAGHLRGEPARAAMREILEGAASEIAEAYEPGYVDRIRRQLEEADSELAIRDLAVHALTLPVGKVDLPSSLSALAPAAAPDADLLTEIVAAWRDLTPDRRWRLVETVRDLRIASLGNRHNQPTKN